MVLNLKRQLNNIYLKSSTVPLEKCRMIHFCVACFNGDILPFCFIDKRLKATDACEGRRWGKVHVLQRPELLWSAPGSFAFLGTQSLLTFGFPFLEGRGILSSWVEIFSATDFVLMEAAGFWAATPEEPAEVGFDSELQLSLLEPELADLFTEVGESIWLPPVFVEDRSW